MSKNRIVKPNKAIVWKEMEGETVLLNSETGDHYILNKVATAIWNSFLKGRDLDTVVSGLADDFPQLPKDALEADLVELLTSLRKAGIITTRVVPRKK